MRSKKIVILVSLFILTVIIIFCVNLININNNKKEFVKNVKEIYKLAQQKYKSEKNKEEIIFSSNSVNGLNYENKDYKYCISYGNNGVSSIEVTNGKLGIKSKTERDIKVSNSKKTSYSTFKCNARLPILNTDGYDEITMTRKSIFGKSIDPSMIEEINFVNKNVVPNKVIDSYDASFDNNGSIMAWYTDKDNNKKYELYIGGNGGVSTGEDISYLFAGMSNLKSIDLTYLDTSNATSMKGMFYYLQKLKKLNLSNVETYKVEDMSYMFYHLTSLEELDLSNFDTKNVKNMENMFSSGWTYKTLNLSKFNTSNVTNMNSMFSGCSKLTSIDISSFDTKKLETATNMFSNCYLLSEIKINEFKINNLKNVDGMLCSTSIEKENDYLKNFSDKYIEKMYTCSN